MAATIALTIGAFAPAQRQFLKSLRYTLFQHRFQHKRTFGILQVTRVNPFTVVWRHTRENIKKCSLRGLESHSDFAFYRYPKESLPSLEGYIVLSMQGDPFSGTEKPRGIIVLDGTWRYTETMQRRLLKEQSSLVFRRIPDHFKTAYPRKQTGCPNPEEGLATVEAVFLAYWILGRDTTGILEHYYWKQHFLSRNTL